MDFDALIGNINSIQTVLQAQAAHAVNLSLTARNWLVGYYIVEFEQHGEDRAEYGENLLARLAERLNRNGLEARRLREFRRVYIVYPQLSEVVYSFVYNNNPVLLNSGQNAIWRTLSAKSQNTEKQEVGIWRSVSAKFQIIENQQENKKLRSVTAKSQNELKS